MIEPSEFASIKEDSLRANQRDVTLLGEAHAKGESEARVNSPVERRLIDAAVQRRNVFVKLIGAQVEHVIHLHSLKHPVPIHGREVTERHVAYVEIQFDMDHPDRDTGKHRLRLACEIAEERESGISLHRQWCGN